MSRSFAGLYFTRRNHIKPWDPLRGAARSSFLEERAARNRADETPCCCIFTARCLSMQWGHVWHGIVKVIVNFSEKVKRSPSNAIEVGFRWIRKLVKEYLS